MLHYCSILKEWLLSKNTNMKTCSHKLVSAHGNESYKHFLFHIMVSQCYHLGILVKCKHQLLYYKIEGFIHNITSSV